MELHFTRIDETLPAPTYATPGSVAFDVAARVDMLVAPGALARIPSNLVVKVPEGYVLMLCSRSSTPAKHGLHVPHGVGLVDQDYCGPSDELLVQVFNPGAEPVAVKRGDRIAQAMLVPIERAMLVESALATTENRGGFGSTGS